MKLLELFVLTTILYTLTHADIKGTRVLNDYLLNTYIMQESTGALPGVQTPVSYPAGYIPGITTNLRPEVITYMQIVTTVAAQLDWVFKIKDGGVNSSYYYLTTICQANNKIFFDAYGLPPIETLTTGSLSIDDSLLHKETYTKSPKPKKVISISVKYPKTGLSYGTEAITWISVLDNTNQDPASVKIVSGGVGFQAVNIVMRSRVGEAANFTVQIYGRNYTTENWPWYLSVNSQSDALMFNYWPWSLVDVPLVKKNKTMCGCLTARVIN